MAFIGFNPCPKCNSKDNLAEYTENFYCFGCGYSKPKRSLKRFEALKSDSVYKGIALTKELHHEARKWLVGYGLTSEEMELFAYNVDNDILVLSYSENHWHGRCFAPNSKRKYDGRGDKPCVIYGNNPETCVIVEDIVSAVKVARQFSAVAMLGAMLAEKHVSALKQFSEVVLWNDRDKARESVRNARSIGELLGVTVKVVISTKDPKEYSNKDIYNFIKT